MHFQSFSDKYHPLLTQFRQQVCRECGAPTSYFDSHLERHEMLEKIAFAKDADPEEVFKYGPWKWQETNFDYLDTVVEDEKVISISGARTVNSWVRVGMHFYTLKDYRRTHRSLFFREGGFLDRHLEWAKNNNLKGFFYSIYPHNRHLKNYIRYMLETDRSLSPQSKIGDGIQRLRFAGGPIQYNHVEQYFFYLPVNEDESFDIHEVIES